MVSYTTVQDKNDMVSYTVLLAMLSYSVFVFLIKHF